MLESVILRDRPTVMISSTILELADVRSAIATGLSLEGLAEGWLFEIHSSASGETPESRYLEIARSCDLYVIIVAAQGSPATEAEYHAAFSDNPTKILAFYLRGATEETAGIRALIDSRHSRIRCEEASDIAPRVVKAISAYIQSGDIVRKALLAEVDRRLQQNEAIVRGALPLCFVPTIRSISRSDASTSLGDDTSQGIPLLQATAAWSKSHHVVLEGIGGSGKTYAALAMARYAGQCGGLPLVLSPANSRVDVVDLISAELDGVRFYAGEALLHEMARSGRLALVIDGVDALASDARRLLLQDVDAFARRFPRSLIVCCIRRTLLGELPDFSRFNLEPLSDVQTADMFTSLGVQRIDRFPGQVAELARWPLWAWALVEVGPTAETGLVLLGRLLEHRVRASGPYPPLETQLLLDAVAVLAFHAWPEAALDVADALDLLETWRSGDPPPAVTAHPQHLSLSND
jgi:hypothetical protein